MDSAEDDAPDEKDRARGGRELALWDLWDEDDILDDRRDAGEETDEETDDDWADSASWKIVCGSRDW